MRQFSDFRLKNKKSYARAVRNGNRTLTRSESASKPTLYQ